MFFLFAKFSYFTVLIIYLIQLNNHTFAKFVYTVKSTSFNRDKLRLIDTKFGNEGVPIKLSRLYSPQSHIRKQNVSPAATRSSNQTPKYSTLPYTSLARSKSLTASAPQSKPTVRSQPLSLSLYRIVTYRIVAHRTVGIP